MFTQNLIYLLVVGGVGAFFVFIGLLTILACIIQIGMIEFDKRNG